jgi:crossover junction endodeoxyribonuclease RuvC
MLILGIDPGLQKTGWGIIRSEGTRLSFISCGLIQPDKDAPMADRLAHIHHELTLIMGRHKPSFAAIEETFVNKNPASALKLGQARGAAMAVPALFNIPVSEYATNKIKKSVTGAGHAAKEQIGMMIKLLLPGTGTISEDEADALAVAICHAHHVPAASHTHRIPAFAGK